MTQKDDMESKGLQVIDEQMEELDKFAANKIIKNIISRQGTEQKFQLKSISDDQLTNISNNMDEFHEVSNIFGRRSSSFSRINLTLNHITPYQNLKQCVAEIENKRQALKENLFNLKKKNIKLQQLKLKLNESSVGINSKTKDGKHYLNRYILDDKLITIEIEEIESSIIDIRLYIEGALKEIAIFQQAYNEIKESHNIHDWDEEDFEKAESEYHLKRCFIQCIRNVTEFGRIRDDNQEWLQQLGINPIVINVLIINYVEQCQKQILNPRVSEYNHVLEFVEELYQRYKNNYIEMLNRKGIKNTYNKNIVYKRGK